jgi:hypothetical protein
MIRIASFHAGVRRERLHLGGADVAHLGLVRVTAVGHGADRDVAVGDDPAELAAVDHEHVPGVDLAHGARGLDEGGIPLDAPWLCGHDLADGLSHCSLLGRLLRAYPG